MAAENVIEVRNVSVNYGSTEVIRDINFSVAKGEIFVIVGGSGSGKSTLMRQMIGLEIPTEGDILIAGESISSLKGRDKRKIQQKFGVLFQSSGLFASMTIAENIALPLETYTGLSREDIAEMIEIKLGVVGLSGVGGYIPSELSGGMKKRAALARAMTLDPDILFFDEPSSGLDPVTSASLDKLILDLNAGLGTTMVIVTHDLASIMSIASHVVMLSGETKSIIAEGTPAELKKITTNEEVFKFFNRLAR